MEEQENPQPSFETPSTPKLLGVGALLARGWEIYTSRFWVFMGISAVIVGLLLMFFGVFAAVIWEVGMIAGFFLGILAFLTFFLGSTWAMAALLCAIRDREERIGVVEAFHRGKPYLFPLLWVHILSQVIVAGGFVLLIIPGIILSVSMSLRFYVLVAENKRGINALIKSRELVRGYWWSVFGRLLVIGLLVFIVIFLGGIIGTLVLGELVGNILLYTLQFLITPLVLAFGFSLYENLRDTKGFAVAEPPYKSRGKYVAVGILGFALPLILGAVSALLVVSMSGTQDIASDAQRQAHIREIAFAMETSYIMNGAYPEASPTIDGGVPFVIEDALSEYLPWFSQDPQSQGSCGGSYCWVDNTGDNQSFCVYAKLEAEDAFFVASEKGAERIVSEPDSLPCW